MKEEYKSAHEKGENGPDISSVQSELVSITSGPCYNKNTRISVKYQAIREIRPKTHQQLRGGFLVVEN